MGFNLVDYRSPKFWGCAMDKYKRMKSADATMEKSRDTFLN